jgi:hypothetical protein
MVEGEDLKWTSLPIGSREIPEASGFDSRTKILSKLDQVRVEILNRGHWALQFIYLMLDYT